MNSSSLAVGQGAITARAMRLATRGARLECERVSLPPPDEHQLLIEVAACGVCRTDLHILDGELPQARYPRTLGHEIVGRVVSAGAAVTGFASGDRVGVPWLARTCGVCAFCRAGAENLCDRPAFTGCSVDGGFASHALADARFCLPIPEVYSDVEAAPLLCAGLIGYRAYRLALGTATNGNGGAYTLGLYGFGAAAHLLAQIAVAQWHRVFVFTRPGDRDAQEFARALGVHWAGDSDAQPPETLDAAILFAPVGELVPRALSAVGKGGTVVCAGIHMSDIPSFPYRLLWGERRLCSVANLTRADGHEFMRVAADLRPRSHVERFPLYAANEALARVRSGTLRGAAVLTMNPDQEAS